MYRVYRIRQGIKEYYVELLGWDADENNATVYDDKQYAEDAAKDVRGKVEPV